MAEWQHLLTGHGLLIDHVETAPMALLQLRRLIADEGFLGALRFATNLLTHPDARRRVLGMRHTFRHHRQHLAAVAVIAHKPDPATRPDAETTGIPATMVGGFRDHRSPGAAPDSRRG